jgi:hypothetical protein
MRLKILETVHDESKPTPHPRPALKFLLKAPKTPDIKPSEITNLLKRCFLTQLEMPD